MKKILFYATIVAMSMTMVMPVNAQSRKEKKAAQKAEWERKQKQKEQEEQLLWQMHMDSLNRVKSGLDSYGTEVNIPCIDASFDDEEYFRDLGIGTSQSNNQQAARLDAVNQAKSMIKARLGEFIQGITSDYFSSYSGTKPVDDVQHKMESKLNGVVDYMLNNADKECEKRIKNERGIWEFYYVIRIPKEDLKKNMIQTIDEDKMLVDFNEHQMQKFMDERMENMLNEKKKAGY